MGRLSKAMGRKGVWLLGYDYDCKECMEIPYLEDICKVLDLLLQ